MGERGEATTTLSTDSDGYYYAGRYKKASFITSASPKQQQMFPPTTPEVRG